MRDIKGDYRRAYLEEYEAFRRAGRSDDAKRIAEILRDHYGHEVAKNEGEAEHTAVEHPAENTANPPVKAATRRPRKPAQG